MVYRIPKKWCLAWNMFVVISIPRISLYYNDINAAGRLGSVGKRELPIINNDHQGRA